MRAPVPPSPSNTPIPRDCPHKHTNKFKKTGEEICFTLSMSIHRQSRCKFGLNSHFNDRRLFSNLESHSNNEIKIIRAMYYYCVMFLLLYTSVIMPFMSFFFYNRHTVCKEGMTGEDWTMRALLNISTIPDSNITLSGNQLT